ncbi:hypothetical protein LSH36_266g01008 [Paralvinella palmiformis]|uniref:Nuclear receptor coactivator 6 TRADD-N domain-containing protein n=1 Tax=Paralvinella palmiformis TaxID=53620 RepID=A0AAD9N2A6_9ANNE|nr:hypothetical protein LSH36_266g01008 [Paralvinella palmiformis]
MGPQEEYIETVVTCEGDYYDPEFHTHLQNLSKRLQSLLTEGDRKLIVKKVEPWNSVRVTFNIPKEAAVRLKRLAEQGDRTLRELGVLAVQIEGHRLISLTIAGKNNETTELVLQTSGTAATGGNTSSVFDLPGTDEINIPGPSNVESTRRNIAQYLRDQGGSGNFFDTLFSQNFLEHLKPPDTAGAAAQSSQNPVFGQFPFGLRGVTNHMRGNRLQLHNEQLPLPPGFPPGSFPSPSLPHTHTFSSPTTSHNQSPLSPNYPTPPPSVSNPSSPGLRTANFNNLAMPGMSTAAALNSLPRLLGNRDITSSSPLLVNLLQNDIGGLAHLNNLMPNKMPGMPFPLSDMGQPPAKRRRKPRKPKPDAGKSRSPAGQEVLTGTVGSVPVAPGACDALQDIPAVRCSQELSATESRTNDLGQLTQDMEAGARVSAASVMNTALSSRSAPSGICHSPGQAVSPRVQSPRTQSPVCAQSPGWSKTQGAFGNNPPHIVNPVTGQLEPAGSVEVQQSVNEHILKDGSLDSDDMANVQLQPPPNPLVELNKDITATKEANLEVPSLSASSQKQSSPKAIIVTMGSQTKLVDSVDVISEHSASAVQTNRSVTTSAAASVTGLNGHADVELVKRNTACSLSQSTSTNPDTSSSGTSVASTLTSTVMSSIAASTCVTVDSVSSTSSLTLSLPTAANAAVIPTASLHPCVSVMEKSIYSSPRLMSHSVSSSVVLPPCSVSDHRLLTTGGCPSVSSAAVHPSTIGSHSPVESLPSSSVSSEVSVATSAVHTGTTLLGPSVSVDCTTTASTTSICVSSDVLAHENAKIEEASDAVVASSGNSTEAGQLHQQHQSSQGSSSHQMQTEHEPSSDSRTVLPSSSHTVSGVDTPGEGAVFVVEASDQMSPTQNNDASPAGSSLVLVDLPKGGDKQCTSAEHADTAYRLADGCVEDGAFNKSTTETSPNDEVLKTEKVEQQAGLIICESPDPALSGTTPEHSGTDGSNTSSVTAHSQGKDSGIADVGPDILSSINCLEKSEEDGNGDLPEHGRSNGASTSEASPLSEVDTVSSGHQSRSPSVRLNLSTSLTNHDSELSSHSFEDHVCSTSLGQNDVSERVPRMSDVVDNHDAVEEKLSESQSAKAELHKCGDKNVITVGYALSKDQPTVDLSLSGLSDKSLPFLTEPSSVFEKDSNSIRLKEFNLDDGFHATNNVQKMKAVSLTHSPLNNGEAQAEDCLNWSKMLSLSPVLLGRSDLNPGGDDKSTGLKNCVITNASSANGDNSVSCLVSENSVCKVSLTVVDTLNSAVGVQTESASAESIHATGILDTVSDKVMLEQGTGSADLLHGDLVSETVESVTGDTRPEYGMYPTGCN